MTTETTTRPTDGTDTAPPRPLVGESVDARGPRQERGGRPRGRFVGAALLVVTAVVGGTLWAGQGGGAPAATRAEQAATARLEQQAEQHDLGRQARSDRAATGRLERQAQQHERGRQARSDRAATARLEQQADQLEEARQVRADAAATARLDALAGRRWVVTAAPVADDADLAAAAARLQQQADRYERARRARSEQAATDRLTRLAEALAGG